MKPETVHILFTRAADCRKGPGTSVMVFVTKSYRPSGSVEFEREPTKENVEAEFAKAGFKVVSWRLINEADIPQDRTFREAWRDSGKHVYHDMPTCREIHKQRIRKARAPLLAELDIEYQRALENNNVGLRNKVVAQKNKLRDATKDPRIDSAATPEELKTIRPL